MLSDGNLPCCIPWSLDEGAFLAISFLGKQEDKEIKMIKNIESFCMDLL